MFSSIKKTISTRSKDIAFILVLSFVILPSLIAAVAYAAALSFNPGSLSFGVVTVGSNPSGVIRVTNTSPTTVSGGVSITGSGYSCVGSNCSYTLPSGSSTLVSIRFSPGSVSSYDGRTANFSSGGGATAYCSASETPPPPVVVNGACGATNGGFYDSVNTPPYGTRCSVGAVSGWNWLSTAGIHGEGGWVWSCLGSGGGSDASCSASYFVPAACGTKNNGSGATYASVPGTECVAGGSGGTIRTIGPNSNAGGWTWQCDGRNDPNPDGCSAVKTASYSCTGSTPSNSSLCSGDSNGLSSDTSKAVVSSCTSARKCEYTCQSGYVKSGNSCISLTDNLRNVCSAAHSGPVNYYDIAFRSSRPLGDVECCTFGGGIGCSTVCLNASNCYMNCSDAVVGGSSGQCGYR